MNDEKTGTCIGAGSNQSGEGRRTASCELLPLDNRAEEAACRSNLDRRGTNLCVARGSCTAAKRQPRRIWPPRRQILFLRCAEKQGLWGACNAIHCPERLTPRTAGESHW
jgi:hypothetical protein